MLALDARALPTSAIETLEWRGLAVARGPSVSFIAPPL
jgi:hypothetical protein